MQIKFVKPKSPIAQAAIDYVLRAGKKPDPNETVTVLRGNPQQVATLADSLDYKNKYSSAVIAWHKDDAPTDEQINEVLNDFERLAFAGLDTQQYAYCAVQHEEKDGSKHLHIIVPRYDMINDKSLNIAPPNSLKTFDTLRDYQNAKNGWKSPDIEMHPENARTIQLGKSRGTHKNLKLAIDTYVTNSILSGHITDRQTLLEELETAGRDLGLEVIKAANKYITIKTPDMRQGIKLKGAIYEQNYNAATSGQTLGESRNADAGNEAARKGNEATDAGNKAAAPTYSQRDINKFAQGFIEAVERRAEYHAKRHPNPYQQTDEANGITSSAQAAAMGLDDRSLSNVMSSNLLASLGIDTAQNGSATGLPSDSNKQHQNDGVRSKRMATRSRRHNYSDAEIAEIIAQQIAKILEMLAKLFGFDFDANFTGAGNDRNRNKAYELINDAKRANERDSPTIGQVDNIILERIGRNAERARGIAEISIEAGKEHAENERAFEASTQHADRLIARHEEQQRQARMQRERQQQQEQEQSMEMKFEPTAEWFNGVKR